MIVRNGRTAGLIGAVTAMTAWPVLAAELPCPAERAVYTLNGDPAFSAGFIPSQHFASMASDLYFRVTTPQRTYWFTFGVSNGYSGISLGPVGSPYIAADGDPNNGPVDLDAGELNYPYMRIYPMDLDWRVHDDPPNKGDTAPEVMFAPELGQVLWYAPRALTTDTTAMRDPMDRGVFRRTGCLDKAPEPGLP